MRLAYIALAAIIALILVIIGIPWFSPAPVITISGSTTIYPLAKRWAELYMAQNPEIKIIISSGGSGKGIEDAIHGLADIGMSSRDLLPQEKQKLIQIVIAYDAVLLIVSDRNPSLDLLRARGLNKSFIQEIYQGKLHYWPGTQRKTNAYTRSDPSGTSEVFAHWLGLGSADELLGLGMLGNPGMVLAVSKDPDGLGYVSMAFGWQPEITAIPIDINDNGLVDPNERIATKQDLLLILDEYPLARKLYFLIRKDAPPHVLQFIQWCLTQGQRYVEQAGYASLPSEIVQAQLQKLAS